ncbi:MAG: serine/threonine-protein kinase [candidate division WOR-3 bacterium]|nr:protein kinase [candidate division WOR-3 bacterium]MDW8113605.1 serine/threonine-protein kinase [candidate division WOR-3 bacterium]
MIIADKYELIKLIKKGLNTTVYLANQKFLNRYVIIKILEIKEEKDFSMRFEREAKILANLDIENIVKIYDYGLFDGKYYIVYEYVKGKSLEEILKERGKIDFPYALYLFHQLIKIFKIISEKNIIHRDIKPSNILIREDGVIKIADFGLAYQKGEKDLTLPGMIIGTPAYMPPEQCLGEKVDERADIYSLGITMIETLSAHNPFFSSSYTQTIQKILNKQELPLKEILKEVDKDFLKILRKLTYKKKEKRYKNFSELLNDIEEYIKKKEIKLPSKKEFADYLFLKKEVIKEGKRKKKRKLVLIKVLIPTFILSLFVGLFFLIPKENKVLVRKESFLSETTKEVDTLSLAVSPKKEEKKERKEETLFINRKIPSKTNFSYLFINCEPWARVYLDNNYLFTTPTKEFLELKPKNYLLTLINDSFGKIETIIELKEKETLTLFFNLKRLKSYLKINVIPWGEVYLDDKLIGITPFSKEIIVEEGKRVLKIKNPHYPIYEETIDFKKGEIIERIIKLK